MLSWRMTSGRRGSAVPGIAWQAHSLARPKQQPARARLADCRVLAKLLQNQGLAQGGRSCRMLLRSGWASACAVPAVPRRAHCGEHQAMAWAGVAVACALPDAPRSAPPPCPRQDACRRASAGQAKVSHERPLKALLLCCRSKPRTGPWGEGGGVCNAHAAAPVAHLQPAGQEAGVGHVGRPQVGPACRGASGCTGRDREEGWCRAAARVAQLQPWGRARPASPCPAMQPRSAAQPCTVGTGTPAAGTACAPVVEGGKVDGGGGVLRGEVAAGQGRPVDSRVGPLELRTHLPCEGAARAATKPAPLIPAAGCIAGQSAQYPACDAAVQLVPSPVCALAQPRVHLLLPACAH